VGAINERTVELYRVNGREQRSNSILGFGNQEKVEHGGETVYKATGSVGGGLYPEETEA